MPKGGKRQGAGRKPGIPNKITTELKEAILQAADEAHNDGVVGYLKQVAQTNSSAFVALLGKVLPLTIAGDKDNPIAMSHSVPAEDLEIINRFIKQKEPKK